MKKRFLSLIIALAMMVGVFTPLLSSAADENAQETTKVYVHKMLMTKAQLDAHKVDKEGYDGNQIENLGTFFGEGAKEIPGVYFVVEKEFNVPDTSEGAAQGATVKAWKAVTATGTQAKGDYSDALAGLTKEITVGQNKFTALELDTSKLPKGTYRINEIHEKSTYKGKDGETLTDMKAVPTEITLPLVNNSGVVTEAHVYPKNTEDKPTTNKDFSEQFTEKQNGRDNGTNEKEVQDNPETSDKEKKANWQPKNVGDTVNYTVRTTIPAKANYATAYWNDEMTDGLDLDITTVKLAYTGNDGVTLEKGTDYTIKPTSNNGKQGFELEFTKTGLGKINGKEKEGVITITYSAKLNEKAVVAVPESNDVNFYYGNNPRKGNTPKPNYPDDNGKLKVTKTWADGEWAKNEKATFRIVDAQTGKTVTKDDLVGAPEEYDFKAEKEIGYAADKKPVSAEWEYLNKNKQYKIVEVSVTYKDENGKVKTLTGWEANYVVNGKGETEVTNYKTNNPTPINPTEPKVVTYGAKFVKTDTEGKRLPGAEFVIRNTKGKFLTGTAADRKAYEAAQKAFEDAIKAYNALEASKQTKEERAKIAKLEKARDDAWNATLKDMTQWGDKANAIKLTSNELGQFEIAGLAPGTYTLVEVTPPDGYANNNNEFPFTINPNGSQAVRNIDFGIENDIKVVKKDAKDETELTLDSDIQGMTIAEAKKKYDSNNDGKLTVKELNDGIKNDKNAQQIINKKVSIPQTGGIGTIIFTAIGLAIMASAIIAIKKRQATEAR